MLRSIWNNTYGLLVDDGQLAVGAIAALVVIWFAAQRATLQENAGWLLLLLVLALSSRTYIAPDGMCAGRAPSPRRPASPSARARA